MIRKNLKLLMGLGVVAGGLLTSCSNEFEPSDVNSGSMLVKAPKVVAYSGDHFWNGYGTRGTDMNANMWDQTWDCPPRAAEDLTSEQLEELKELFRKAAETRNEIVLPFENYYVQQIYKGEDRYNAVDKNHNVTGTSEVGSNKMEHLQAMGQYGYEHINNFNYGTNGNHPGNCGCGVSHFGTTLMTGMPTEGLDPNTQFGFDETWGTNPKFYNNYIIVEYEGYYYVGFDYEAHAPERQNPNEANAFERDWNFTDWIVRITPAYHKGQTPEGNPGGVQNPGTPETPEEPNNPDVEDCPNCEHPAHEGVCPDCKDEGLENSECNPQDGDSEVGETPETPETPGDNVNKGFDEVEINLSLDNKDADDIRESHLSMHVRSATDVKVFIPVPKMYYCEADDMAIVLDHTIEFVHGGPYVTEYNINGNIVTLNVEFNDAGITIWTDGITQEVIDYCFETYGDGITFEVWNYFNDPETGNPLLSIEELKGYLNQSTVEFLDKIPGQYINSFGKDHGRYENDGSSDGNDFHVGPTAQQAEFDGPEQGAHLNGSDNNDIYTKK